ncbi:pyruvate dehydrogenase E2 component (dihydrolipoamide acetyltransferase) [Gemmobacter caeni]|jgi:pyruvate dehydrogenase E2 component (dihydrolipoamide acetyltransferase)|uniref:Acetyltransferase component of pyruvate dehydrogenase complex n=3 Tax=Gemmobacter TaxID=204456 RepID=A0A2T6AQ38_9RHOB|nr:MULTISPECIES: pyruvate dehydrogenase complex dihydrolipoamide acetyltransferase [Gemmobacter]PTX45948.1 pyruvate dehydrogenase E2 component (dihydrolipoamide acetyltransferase) [Gemmobacter caeni]TWI94250.1 pyruvate dehydrogenase E2 component (dihydrolipoamide acetyltransferase) [Gemmobacter caeni]GHC09863.1 acetyltransferase component of pyruvate dehydrogenase complex [Gemmobacter nanjingensis]
MAIQVLMPALSPTMEEGTLAKWLVKEGDEVKSGQVLAEIETDKATMEFEAVDEGVIGKILIAEGSAGVKVNTPIAVLLEEGEDASAAAAPAPKAESAAPAAAPAAAAPAAAPAPAAPVASGGARVFASPLARRIAAEKGLDLSAVKGSGPHGRIVKADVEGAAAAPKAAAPAAAATPAAAAAPAPAAAPAAPSADAVKKLYADRAYEEVPLDGMRRTIAARLTEAKQTIPHFYLRREVQLDTLMAFREQLNKSLEGRGVKLSVNDFIIKASALALQKVPDCNAVWAGDRILKMKPSDVAVAVAIDGGLFTPVLKDADKKSLSALSAEMKDLAARAKSKKLAPHEYQGGSFAISNLGMMGVENFDAVINPPHGSILAVGAGVKKPVVNKAGEIVVATMMSMTLSVDHRVIDGALGAEFLKALIENLENPMMMLA